MGEFPKIKIMQLNEDTWGYDVIDRVNSIRMKIGHLMCTVTNEDGKFSLRFNEAIVIEPHVANSIIVGEKT
jgi:hypothetical protein